MNAKLPLVTLAIVLFSINSISAQIVTFNDANFKNALLLNTEINVNNDDEIQMAEAAAFSGKLELTNVEISDLTGLEAFAALKELVYFSSIATDLNVSSNTSLERLTCTNLNQLTLGDNEALKYLFTDQNNYKHLEIDNSHLDTLICWHNNNAMTIGLSMATSLEFLSLNDNLMPELDVSSLTELKRLDCDVNLISNLDLSKNLLLEYLECKINPLAKLDVGKNKNLKYLSCSSTQLASLNVSQNAELETLVCDYTPLTFLDVSNNEKLIWLDCFNANLNSINAKNGKNESLQYFDMRENLNLECMQVDDENYSSDNWFNVPTTAIFKEACEGITGVHMINETLLSYNAYPNPTKDKLTIDLNRAYDQIEVQVFNSFGQLAKAISYSFISTMELEMDVEPGLYLVNIRADESEIALRVVKE